MRIANTRPEQTVNLKQYPIAGGEPGLRQELIAACQKMYARSGLCEFPDFILPGALDELAAEANSFSRHAYFCNRSHNAYLGHGKPSGDSSQVETKMQATFVGSVPYDRIEPDSLINRLYQWDTLKDFIAAVLGRQTLYRFCDPFGACSINVFVDGGEHGWHFDESEFTITLMLQPPEAGGEFEYVAKIRGSDNERHIVADILDGGREDVVKLAFTPGTLLIFGGRETLHRVTKVHGTRPRLVPVFCYSEQPGMENSESVRKLFWGRSNPHKAGVNYE